MFLYETKDHNDHKKASDSREKIKKAENKSQRDVIQRRTGINYYQGDITMGNQIADVVHARVALNDIQRNNAVHFPYHTNVCNHHVPYHMISQNIIDHFLTGKQVGTAISDLNTAINTLTPNADYSIQPFEGHKSPLEISQKFDDAIANIANDPRNLFYSKFHSGDGRGTLIDYPTDQNQQQLNAPILKAYRKALRAARII